MTRRKMNREMGPQILRRKKGVAEALSIFVETSFQDH